MRRALVLVSVLAGCDGVFGLTHVTAPPDGVSACDAPTACAGQNPHDEDGDGMPDACDACPHLTGASADVDCDGIGAACDPDETVPDEQLFTSFETADGIALWQALVENDGAHLLPPGVMYSEAIVDTRVPSPAIYELTGVLHDPDATLQTTSLIVRDADSVVATSPYIEATVQFEAGVAYFLIEKADATNVKSPPLGSFSGALPYSISLQMTHDTVTAKLSGFASSTLVAPTDAYPAVEYGADAYRTDASGTFFVETHYLRRVAPVL